MNIDSSNKELLSPGTGGSDYKARNNFRVEDLPVKMQVALHKVLVAGEKPIMLFKTAWKPKPDIPTLWAVYTNQRFFLFSTRGRGTIFREATFANINAVTAQNNQRIIQVLVWSPEDKDIVFQVSESVSAQTVQDFVQAVNKKALEARDSKLPH